MEPIQQPAPAPTAPNMSTGAPVGGRGDKKRLIVLGSLGLLIAIGLGALVYLLWGNSDRIDADQPVNTITINKDGFMPATIKIKKGQEVAWANEDEDSHEVVADQEVAPSLDSSGPLLKGDTYVYQFEKEGTINYYDPQNPAKLKGTVIVE